VVAAAAVYSWLVTQGFGVDEAPCLKLPARPLIWAWFIPAAFALLTGCIAATQTLRAFQISQYLKSVEAKVGLAGLGWEACIGAKFSSLTVVIVLIWLTFLVATIFIGVLASSYIAEINSFCPPSK
jgi:hypothetical protein